MSKSLDKGRLYKPTGQKRLVSQVPASDVKFDDVRTSPLRPGEKCPQCKRGELDYDGLLNLTCPVCGYSWGGCFT